MKVSKKLSAIDIPDVTGIIGELHRVKAGVMLVLAGAS